MTDTRFFLIRSDNDLDHVTPVIDALLAKSDTKFIIYTRDPLRNLNEDYRVQHLLKSGQVQARDVRDYIGGSQVRRFRSSHRLRQRLINFNSKRTSRIAKEFIGKYISKVRKKIFSIRDEAEASLDLQTFLFGEGISLKSLASDYGIDDFTKRALKFAREQGVKTFAFPHSIDHAAGLFLGNSFKLSPAGQYKRYPFEAHFDHLLAVNQTDRERMMGEGIDSSRISVIGSLRFSQPWIQKLRDICPAKATADPRTDKVKVLLVMSKFIGHVDQHEVNRIMRAIMNDDRFILQIKPHTRFGYNELPKDVNEKAEIIGDAVPTFVASDMADVVLFWGTSFIYDPLVMNKRVLQLKYVFAIECDFEAYLGEWEITSRDQMARLFDKLASEPGYDPIAPAKRQECIHKMVSGEVEDNYKAVQKAFST